MILQNISLRVGFEPTREDPNWFLVNRLNHSAIAAEQCKQCSNIHIHTLSAFPEASYMKGRFTYFEVKLHSVWQATYSNYLAVF